MGRMIDEDGNLWDVGADGVPVFVGREGGAQPMTLGQVDPRKTAGAMKDTIDAQTAGAIQGATIQEALAKAEKAAMEVAELKAKASRGGLTGEEANGYRQKIATLDSLTDQINRVQDLFNQSQTGFSPLEYAPLPGNRAFDAASAGLAQLGTAAFRVPGQGSQSDFEAKQFMDANQPSSWSMDAANLERLRTIRTRIDQTRAELGLAPAQWQGLDGSQTPTGAPTAPSGGGGATGGGNGGGTLPGGPQGGSGGDGLTFDDGTFVNFSQIDAMGGMEALRAKHGEPRLNVDVTDDSPLDPAAVAARDTFGGAVDTTVRNVANMATFGLADKLGAKAGELFGNGTYEQNLARQQYQNRIDAEANPYAAFAGDVGGALLGTSGIAKLGASTLGRVAPITLGGGRAAQFGRNLGTDATFGGGTAAAQGQDVGTGALMATLGSGLGQGAAGAIGRAAMPVTAPIAKKLSDSGITLSLGQIMRDRGGVSGRMIGGIEDRMAGYPVVGDLIEGVRTRGVEDFNKLDMNDALTAIGGRVDAPGMAGYAQADQAVSDAYTAALNPMRLQADQPFNQALGASPQYADDLVRPFMGQNGELAGEGLQAAKQAIQGEIAANRGVPGGFGNVRTLQDLNAALLGMAQRQAPDLAQGYKNADTAFEALYPIRTSVAAAGNKQGVYTPAQKGMQLRATDKSSGKRQFALGNRSGQDLQRAAQELLPSRVPDSGTAGRLLVGGIGLGAGGAGSTGLVDPNIALPIAAIASLYTKTGQKAVAKALLSDRPKAIQSIGAKIRKRKGLFGSAAIPLMMQPSTVN